MAIRMLLADVDGTLVTQDKVLTDRAIAAVGKLKQAGILFAVTSGRPPRGMSMLIEPLGADWFVRDAQGPHVARETWTVRFDPTPVDSFAQVSDGVAKVVGVSDDYDAVQRAVDAVRESFGDHVSAAKSQPYYGDITHPEANKGAVARYLSQSHGVPAAEIATIGDQPNDVLMFAHSGLSIAMGNASPEVQRAARQVTTTNEDEGFANAVERFILP
jgi:hydroxymethylpyrimidine pyrophosphatase-like HAD family hydrolase